MAFYLYPKCLYTPAIVSDTVGFHQINDFKAHIPPLEHLTSEVGVHDVHEYINLARTGRSSQAHNCDVIWKPVGSNLNLLKWAHYLDKYKDTRLLQFMTYGFPLGDMNGDVSRQDMENHSSAIEYGDTDRCHYGSLTNIPADCCHISPLMSRPQEDNKRRIILDLSYGEENSVNGITERGSYDGCPYTLTLLSLDYLIRDILDCHMEKRTRLTVS